MATRGLACLVVALPAVPVASQTPASGESAIVDLLDAGEASLREGDYKKAIRVFAEALELSGDGSTKALHGMGTAYLQLSKPQRAQECGRKILEIAEKEVERAAAENLIGSALVREALDMRPGDARQKALAEAESHLRASLDLWSGQMSIAWFNLSVALQHQDRLDEALEAQKEYVQRTPESRDAKTRLCGLQYLADPAGLSWEATGAESRDLERHAEEGGDQATDVSIAGESRSPDHESREPFRVGGDVLPPRKLFAPMPQYTEWARENRIQGVVILEAIIDRRGRVTDVKVLKGLPGGLDQSAAETARTWRFEPATRNGEPVAVWFNLTTRFSLEGGQVRVLDDQSYEVLNLPEGAVVQPPVNLSSPPPTYTEAARLEGVEGVVIIEAIIDATGRVTDVRVLKGLPLGLSKQAALAVCRWEFEPATVDGRPVAVVYNMTANFRLK